jgi:hypothetical protein
VQFGDAAYAFGLVPEHTIGQLAAVPTLDATTLKVFLTRHEPSGATCCAAPSRPTRASPSPTTSRAASSSLLARDVAYVVVDTPAGLDERTLAVLEQATDVVLVSSLDVSSIRNLGKSVDALDRVGLLPPSRSFVLNRADARVGIEPADVEAALGMSIDSAVPSSRAIPFSMNQGHPIVLAEPGSPAARELPRSPTGSWTPRRPTPSPSPGRVPPPEEGTMSCPNDCASRPDTGPERSALDFSCSPAGGRAGGRRRVTEMKTRAHDALFARLGLGFRLHAEPGAAARLRRPGDQRPDDVGPTLLSPAERQQLVDEIMDDVVASPPRAAARRPTISEVDGQRHRLQLRERHG